MTTEIIVTLIVVLLFSIWWKVRQARQGETTTALSPHDAAAPATDVESQVRQLIAQGKLLDAIKLMRERRGIGLKEAHDAVQALHNGHSPQLSDHTPQLPPRLEPAQAAAHPEFRRLIAADRRIEAIKFYKEATECGLKEAKEAMDRAVEEFQKQ